MRMTPAMTRAELLRLYSEGGKDERDAAWDELERRARAGPERSGGTKPGSSRPGTSRPHARLDGRALAAGRDA